MENFLIKIGKLISMVKQDPSFAVFRSMSVMLSRLFARVGDGEILIITGGIGDSALYRGSHIAEELNAHHFCASTTTQSNPFLMRYLDRFDVFILHRVHCTGQVDRFIEGAKKRGKTVIFETDDLTFDPQKMMGTNVYAKMNTLERAQYDKGQSRCVLEHAYVQDAITTTGTLAKYLEHKGKNTLIVPNKLSYRDRAWAQDIITKREQSTHFASDAITIGYFSGSSSHDRDFAVVADALLYILERYTHTRLLIMGPLVLDVRFQGYQDRVIRQSYAPRRNYFETLAKCDIAIAPLEVADDFCESKSAIKFMEAGLLGVPIVASATKSFVDTIENHVNGFIAEDTEEWKAILKRLIMNADLRQTIGHNARASVLQNHTTSSAGNETYYTFLRHKIGGIKDENITQVSTALKNVDTAIVIANWNGKEHLETCLQSLQEQTDQNFVVIVVDNGSDDGSRLMAKKDYPNVSWIALGHNTGFAHANNVGINAAFINPRIINIVTLNNDTKVDAHCMEFLRISIAESDRQNVGALQTKVLNFYDRKMLDSTGVVTSVEMSALNRGRTEEDHGQYDRNRDIFGPSASAALYTREALESLRLPHAEYFDRDYFAYYEDVDLAWRLRYAGYHVRFVPDARVYHVHSATGKSYSPFKAFHIHRNYYYNIAKNAPFLVLIAILGTVFVRYVLLLVSVLYKKGASAKLKEHTSQQKNERLVAIVGRAWRDFLTSIPLLMRKRRKIQPSFIAGHRIFIDVMRRHRTTLKKVIFDS